MVSIVIPTYENPDYLELCIQSIVDSTDDYELIVIDNGSDKKEFEKMFRDKRILKLLHNDKNEGFPKACNQGIEAAMGEYICLLNDDTIVTSFWLERLMYHINENDCDIVAPCSNYSGGEQRYITKIYNGIDGLNIQAEVMYQQNKQICRHVNWLIGFCMLFKKELAVELGGLDEQYGLGNSEDIDFCLNANSKGYKTAIAQDVYIHHFGGRTNIKIKYDELLETNQKRCIEKWGKRSEQIEQVEPVSEKGDNKTITKENIINDFHTLYYKWDVWKKTYWGGIPVSQFPVDLWIFQEILFELKPDIIIECGTYMGGMSLFFASLCDIIGNGIVITIDIKDWQDKIPDEYKVTNERIKFLKGSSISKPIIEQVNKLIKKNDTVMVILDSDHHKKHVLEEMKIYGNLVTAENYMVVCDTNLNGNPVMPNYGESPAEAVEEFMECNKDFYVDKSKEKFLLTQNAGGFLKKL